MADSTRRVAQTLDDIYDAVQAVAPGYGVRAVGVFGSFARGDQKPSSDVDLAVQFPPTASLMDVEGFRADMERLVGRDVDVVSSLVGASPAFCASLKRDLVRLYEG